MGTNRPSAEELEQKANRERTAVERTYTQLRRDLREQTDVRTQILRRPAAAYGVAGFFGLIMGYKFGRALKGR